MDKRAAAQRVLLIEIILDVEVLEAYFPFGESYVDLGGPFAVSGFQTQTGVGNLHSVLEILLRGGGEERSVHEYAAVGGDLQFWLIRILLGSHGRDGCQQQC